MICNHCTREIPAYYYRTRNGPICENCRDEIIAASRSDAREDDPDVKEQACAK